MTAGPELAGDRLRPSQLPDLLADRDLDRRRFELTVPEGITLDFELAGFGDRVAAFFVDLLLVVVALLLLILIATTVAGVAGDLGVSLLYLGVFVLRTSWWTLHELRSGGTTPGKRRLGLRVIDAHGDALRPLQVVVRNLTRELEMFLPLLVLLDPTLLLGHGPAWLRLLSSLWLLAFLLPPLIDRQGRRVGDLLAGTLVIREPRRRLGAELGAAATERGEQPRFTAAQLALYGIYELQVLEKLLRDERRRSKTLDAVAEQITRKIGWQGRLRDVGGSRGFLEGFYRAQRDRLEHDLSLGRAREDKADRPR